MCKRARQVVIFDFAEAKLRNALAQVCRCVCIRQCTITQEHATSTIMLADIAKKPDAPHCSASNISRTCVHCFVLKVCPCMRRAVLQHSSIDLHAPEGMERHGGDDVVIIVQDSWFVRDGRTRTKEPAKRKIAEVVKTRQDMRANGDVQGLAEHLIRV